jgi:hypothetical protein
MATPAAQLPSKDEASAADAASPVWWDEDALIDPHAPDLEEGRRRGREEGREAGYREGLSIGRTTGLEHGLEVGFIRGCVEAVRRQVLLPPASSEGRSEIPWRLAPSKLERVRKTVLEISALLDDFPGPSEIFATSSDDVVETTAERRGGASAAGRRHEADSDDDLDDDDDDEEAQASDKTNVRSKLQRLRARFKLLAVQLGMPHLSLAHAMDRARDSTTDAVPSSPSSAMAAAAAAGAEESTHHEATTEW